MQCCPTEFSVMMGMFYYLCAVYMESTSQVNTHNVAIMQLRD